MKDVLNGYVGMHREEGRFLKTLNPLLRLWSNGWIETDLDGKWHYNRKCLSHQALIQQNIYIVVLDKISHLQVKMVAIVT